MPFVEIPPNSVYTRPVKRGVAPPLPTKPAPNTVKKIAFVPN